jgi:N-acylneuraminate cytidylyltransferase
MAPESLAKKKVLAVIPARGGSKGLPGKNLRPLHGQPLLYWTLEAARKSKLLDLVVLSSEDPDIIAAARAIGLEVPFTRPAELSRDETPGIEPLLHAVRALPGYDYLVTLQPTSPLRTAADIDACVAHCVIRGATSSVSVSPARENPAWTYSLEAGDRLVPVSSETAARRQDLPARYVLNGAVYVTSIAYLLAERKLISPDCVGHPMPRERSVDIDDAFDFVVAEALLTAPLRC